jgi:hypothetical protein
MGRNRNELLAEIENTKRALLASENRGRKAVRKLREIERIFESIMPKMKAWNSLPVSGEAHARIMTTAESRELEKLLCADEKEGAERSAPSED